MESNLPRADSSEQLQQTTSMASMSKINSNYRSRMNSRMSNRKSFINGMRICSLLRTWTEVSKINYFSSQPLEMISSGTAQSIRRKSIGIPTKEVSINDFFPPPLRTKSEEELFAEQFPTNVTPLMNEGQYWGCFYIFPELYSDVYSPVVRIRDVEDVPELVGGVLTRDMITTCLSYLKRTPLLGDYVLIRLDLSSKHLVNIEVLQHYKFLVYLDLSSNLLTDLTVLSYLPYLQYLSVNFNRLSTVLEYETPQWFLTEVHYKYNSVKRIRDISMFWSITILDLSHNNIKCITGLDNLRYLRRLDLSFNHIQRLENLNHLNLLWLDVSYNNISSFEFGPQTGLWTLLHLEYLNLNENNFTSMKIFSECSRLREVHARNNRLTMLLELAVYMRQMRRLTVLDLRENPICSTPSYKDVVINTFPNLLSLDATELEPIDQRTYKMNMAPDVCMFSQRRLLRLLFIEQLSRSRVSTHVPPADTTEVPIVVIVGYEAVGKGTLARRLATECSEHVELALLHTTAQYHIHGHYIPITRNRFDDMLLAGEFLTYSEIDGESYGLSREQAFIKDGKVKIATMDLLGALMLRHRGRRPYLILATCADKEKWRIKKEERYQDRNQTRQTCMAVYEAPTEKSTLQVLISGRILITGILNEIMLQNFPDEKEQSEFVIESECSLLMDSDARQAAAKEFAKGFNMITLLDSSASSLEEGMKNIKVNPQDPSLCSLYKESQNTDEYASDVNNGRDSYQSKKSSTGKDRASQSDTKQDKSSNVSRPKSVDFSRYVSSTWKGLSGMNSAKSSKSVTFTSADANNPELEKEFIRSGMLIEAGDASTEEKNQDKGRSISAKIKMPQWLGARASPVTGGSGGAGGGSGSAGGGGGAAGSTDDLDLWLAFIMELGLMRTSLGNVEYSSHSPRRHDTRLDDPDFLMRQLACYNKMPLPQNYSTNIRDDYDDVHRKYPGFFWDTVNMDDPEKAFIKMKKILKSIVNMQKNLKPMFDLDFVDSPDYPNVEKRLMEIRDIIAPHQLFY